MRYVAGASEGVKVILSLLRKRDGIVVHAKYCFCPLSLPLLPANYALKSNPHRFFCCAEALAMSICVLCLQSLFGRRMLTNTYSRYMNPLTLRKQNHLATQAA